MISKLLPPEVAHFNPLPPHGGRRNKVMDVVINYRNFNPLPPHGGRLPDGSTYDKLDGAFQSTPSAWRETSEVWKTEYSIYISIHSLRMEGDLSIIQM